MTRLALSEIHFTAARQEDVRSGLLGFVSCVVDDRLYLDGITVRRTRGGRLTLSFPERRTRRGSYPYMRPINDLARADIERAILGTIGIEVVP